MSEGTAASSNARALVEDRRIAPANVLYERVAEAWSFTEPRRQSERVSLGVGEHGAGTVERRNVIAHSLKPGHSPLEVFSEPDVILVAIGKVRSR
jgi:hypothetical protein